MREGFGAKDIVVVVIKRGVVCGAVRCDACGAGRCNFNRLEMEANKQISNNQKNRRTQNIESGV